MATIFLSKSRCPSVASLDARMNLWQPRRKNRFFSFSSSDFLLLLRSWSHSWLSFRRLGALSVASSPPIPIQPCTSLAVKEKKAWIYRSCLKRWMQHRLLPPSSDPHNAACHSIPLLLPTVVVVLLILGLVLLLIALSKTSPPHDMLPEQVAVQHLQIGFSRCNFCCCLLAKTQT